MNVKRIAKASCLLLSVTVFSALFARAQAGGQPSLDALRAACADDAQRLCAGVQPGGGRVVACLKEHKDSLSDRCKQAAGLAANPSGSSAPSAAGSPATPAASVPRPGTPPAATATKAAQGTATSAAEKFVEHVITDTEHEGMRAATIHLPEKWRFESKIEWHYNWVEYPLSYSAHAENPDNSEAYFQYPLLRLETTEVAAQLRQYDKSRKLPFGTRLPTGALSGSPQPPMQALEMFIKNVRPNVTNLKWIGQQDLPDLAKALNLDPWPNQHGVAIKIGYDLNGQPVEEAFFGVYYLSQGANEGVNAGMIKQTNWGFQALQSMRAPAGTLDKRMPMFCVIAKSIYVNPEWVRLSKAINDKMLADFNQKLKQGYDQLRAAQATMEQTMKDQASFQANFDKQEAAWRNSPGVNDDYLRDHVGGGSGGGGRSASDHWSDLIRGVDTLNDPSTGGTTQLSNLGQYHYTDGFGNYRTYDNPNDTPENHNEVGSWQQMTTAQ